MAPKIVNREEKRREIFEAAMVLFAQKGVARTTIQQIADAAGIGKGTIDEYFKSKDDILATSFDYIKEESEALIAKKIQNTSDPVQKLTAFIEGILSFFQTFPENMSEILLVFWAEGILNSPRDAVEGGNQQFDLRSMYEDYNDFVTSILEDGKSEGMFRKDIDSYALAAAMIGAIDGLMLQWVLLKDRIDMEKSSRQLVEVFLQGIQTENEGE